MYFLFLGRCIDIGRALPAKPCAGAPLFGFCLTAAILYRGHSSAPQVATARHSMHNFLAATQLGGQLARQLGEQAARQLGSYAASSYSL